VRILHVITTLDVGGAEMHVLAQIRGQRARGHEIRVAYLKGRGSLEGDARAAGAERVERTGADPLALWPHLRWAEIVHTHLLKADMATAPLALIAGRRAGLVASKHNDEQVLRKPLVSRIHGCIGSLPRRTIVLSDHVGRFVAEHGRVPLSRQTRIYYGLDPEPFARAAARPREDKLALRRSLGLGEDDVVATCVARFAPQKAHDVLLRALQLARSAPSGERIRLLLVGDDPFGDGRLRAEALARELGLERAAVFAGIRRDVPEILAASDVFAMSSLWEGLGLVFLEAMAARLPVVATRVSAVPEVVEDGVTGLLVPPSDPRAFAEALVRLARDPQMRARLGAAGELRVRTNFTLDAMVDATLRVYREVLGPRDR
jgi:glycosyltransferase involved in cell wall biosynthesis